MSEKTQLDMDKILLEESTIHEDNDRSFTDRESVSINHRGSRALIRLPEGLAGRYTIISEMQAKGGEADLVLVQDASNKQMVAKLYRPGIVPKIEILESLKHADSRYVIRQLEYGERDGRWYEIMEYAEDGSLRDILERESYRIDSDSVRTILKSLVEALSYLHGLTPRVVHRDLKPENILVRSRNPLDIVLGDFGISSVLDQSIRFTSTNRSVRYSAPEAMAGSVSPATDWWSLGIMLVEMLSGRHPFAGLDERVVTHALYERRPIDLLGVADPDWQLLCKGLLCFDVKKRWGADEIGRWLAGDQALEVHQDQAAPQSQGARAVQPYRIAGEDCWTLGEFVSALALNWDEALKRVARRTDIERWLLNGLQDQDAYNAFLDVADVKDADPLTQLISLLMILSPGSIPDGVNPAEVKPEFLQVCLQAAAGMAEAQHRLGVMYLKGEGLPADAGQAESWLSKAASQGDAVARDALQEIVQFREALAKSESEDVDNWYELGRMYDYGWGTVADCASAVKWYRKAAEGGHVMAQNNLAISYRDGSGVAQDYSASFFWLCKSAEQGFPLAQFNLARSYGNGLGVVCDDVKALEWYKKAADSGYDEAILALGLAYGAGRGVAQDDALAFPWYLKAADKGNAVAQYFVGMAYSEGKGVPQDEGQAFAWYEKAAQCGDSDAQVEVGLAYEYGRGVVQDYVRAVEWYRKAAEQGFRRGQYCLGFAYDKGTGVVQDCSLAAEWYRKAAEQDHMGAQTNLGGLYYRGRGVSQDYGQALFWYGKAAQQGESVALYNMGVFYADGVGVTKDCVQAAEWYRKSAEQGYDSAQFNLGLMYERGEGVPRDGEQAVMWLRKSAEQGNVRAQCNLGRIYMAGELFSPDYAAALIWCGKAAEQGDVDSQVRMGLLYENGYGVAKDAAIAVGWYRKAAGQGSSWGQEVLAKMYFDGIGVPVDYKEGLKWCKTSAENGNTDAQCRLGWMYACGKGVPIDDGIAFEWYKKSAEGGNSDGQYNLGLMYEKGKGVGKDAVAAARWFSKSANSGNINGKRAMGFSYLYGRGIPANIKKGIELLVEAAESGDVYAQRELGGIYDSDSTFKDVSKNDKIAANWYSMAAENGDVEAQKKLLKVYTKLATSGHAEYQYSLSVLFSSGKFVEKNEKEAVRWLWNAAEQGVMLAQREIGLRYATGAGVPKSKRNARSWYKKAIAQGDSESLRLIEDVKGWF